MQTYTTRGGLTQYKPSIEEAQEAAAEQEGFCLACGERQSGIEPDARRCTCEACGAPKVYGAEELVLMGLVH